jgi:L-iditol 2-dehydrogenase
MAAVSTASSVNSSANSTAIPKTMRAGVYREKGIVRVEEVPVPEVGRNEVLIKVAACGICGTDIKKVFYAYVSPPQILGHELAGTVVAVGAGVTKWRAGCSRNARNTKPPGSPAASRPMAVASPST